MKAAFDSRFRPLIDVVAIMKKPLKVLIVAPYWNNPRHVGVLRVERFVRWLKNNGHKIVLLSGGTADNVQESEWGVEITIKDPLMVPGKYAGETNHPHEFQFLRRAWRTFSYIVFSPDQTIFWAKKIVKHPIVNEHIKDIDLVLSSSPPVSVHISASLISQKYSVPLIVDLRDGWLDEPLRPMVEQFKLRKYLEGKWERKVVTMASHIFVTSSMWKQKLLHRFPNMKEKITVLTNGYPLIAEKVQKQENKNSTSHPLTLIHAGQFSASRATQKISYLLRPILTAAAVIPSRPKGEIILLGNLEQKDLIEFNVWRARFRELSWDLVHVPHVPRNEVPEKLREADGLLLLSVSIAAIPSKLYEYIPTAKPILAVTLRGSAVWELCEDIPQVFLFDCSVNEENDCSVVQEFINACRTGNHQYAIPAEFTEEHLSKIFDKVIEGTMPLVSSTPLSST